MDTELKIKIGQMLMAGFPSTEADEQAKALIRDFYVGNFILFARNIVHCEQTGSMCQQLSGLVYDKTGHVPLIATSQEGGSTIRTVEGAAMCTGAMATAAADGDTYWLGKNSGEILKSLGINTDGAPVLDVNSNPRNPIIGVRSYGDTAQKVEKYGLSMLQGVKDSGVLAMCKHYPGHGNVCTDSHLSVPHNTSDAAVLYQTDFEPFGKAFAAGADALMSCHVVFDSMDKDNPATLSYRIMTTLLRDEMHFEGIAVTDCLEMGAIGSTWGPGEGAVRAVEAGCDMLCFSHTYAACGQAAEALYAAVASGRLSEERINVSYERILRVKRRYGLVRPFVFDAEKARKVIFDPQRIAKNASVSRQSVTCLKDNGNVLSKIGPRTAFLAPRSVAQTVVDNAGRHPASFAETAAAHFGGSHLVMPLDEMNAEVRDFIENSDADVFVLGLFNARARKGQLDTLRLLENTNKPFVCVLLGSPYEADLISKADCVIATYEYTPLSVNSLISALSEGRFEGKLPVAIQA